MTQEKSPKYISLSWRCFIIALILLPFNYRWQIECEALRYTFPTLMAPFYNVIFDLLIMVLLNLPLKKFAPEYALTGSEFLGLYVLMSMSVLFMSYDMFLPLVSIIAHAFWFASPENEWMPLFGHFLPGWLTISDRETLRHFYQGDSTFYTARHIQQWLGPALWWCAFTFVLVFVMHCMNVIFRKQWVEQERLAYPIVHLPYHITNNSSEFFRSKPMWIGFGIAAGISLLNGFHILYPVVPQIPNKGINLAPFFTEKPFNALTRDDFSIIVYPFAVGLGFIMPLDLLLSCIVFFFFYKAQYVFGSIAGLDSVPAFPYRYEQNIGAYTGVCVIALWHTRRHIIAVLRSIFTRAKLDDADEPMRYRTAVIGVIVGAIFLVGFSMKGGMSLWITVLFFAAHFAIAITLTRIRAELGFPIHSTTFIGPHHSLTSAIGTRRLGGQDLTWFALYFWFNRDNRNHPMPHQLEAFKLAERGNINSKHLSWAMIATVIISMPVCLWMLLDTFFKLGVDSGRVGGQINSFGGRGYGFLQLWLTNPTEPDVPAIMAMTVGFLFTIFLAAIRTRLFWWPLHPLGYGLSFHTHLFWAAFLISCLAKWGILKYGGLRAYRKSVPLFLGLVLGDFVIGSFWNILSIILNRPMYTFYY
jgi:hypothetical protein